MLTPGGSWGSGEHPLVLAWTRAEQTTFKKPALPTPDPLSSSLLPLLLSLSQGVAEAGLGQGTTSLVLSLVWSPVPIAGLEEHSRGIRQCQITAQYTMVTSQSQRGLGTLPTC